MNSKISVFYHIWSPADTELWNFLVDEQIKRLYRSTLHLHADIYCAISGPSAHQISNFVSLYDWIQILQVSQNDPKFGGLTLKNFMNIYEIYLKNKHVFICEECNLKSFGDNVK